MPNLDEIVCTKCNKPKEKKEFRARSDRRIGRSSWCRECLNEWRRQAKIKSPQKYADKQFALDLMKNYGLTYEQYEDLYNAQKGYCACCGSHESNFKRRLHVDHDHISDQVRGLLCTRCNPGLGYFEDSVEKLEMAITYLNKFKKLG